MYHHCNQCPGGTSVRNDMDVRERKKTATGLLPFAPQKTGLFIFPPLWKLNQRRHQYWTFVLVTDASLNICPCHWWVGLSPCCFAGVNQWKIGWSHPTMTSKYWVSVKSGKIRSAYLGKYGFYICSKFMKLQNNLWVKFVSPGRFFF